MASESNSKERTDERTEAGKRPKVSRRAAAYVPLIPYLLPVLLLLVLAMRGMDGRGVAMAVHLWSFLMVSFGQFGFVSPALVEERMSSMSSGKGWDKLLVDIYGPLFSLFPFLLYLFFPSASLLFRTALWWPTLLALSGTALFFACMRENEFFSTVVRIQSERQHEVCDTGPYAMVRHPSYVGLLLGSVGLMFLAPTWPVIACECAAMVLLVLRTVWEDQTLQKELGGYAEYSRTVKYRLVPLVF